MAFMLFLLVFGRSDRKLKKAVIVKNIEMEKYFTAGDQCRLAEVFHPEKEPLPFDSYSLSHAYIDAFGRTLPHRLKNSSETYVVLSGEGMLFVDGESFALSADTCAVVPPGSVQYVENKGGAPLEFLCIVTPPWNADDEEISG